MGVARGNGNVHWASHMIMIMMTAKFLLVFYTDFVEQSLELLARYLTLIMTTLKTSGLDLPLHVRSYSVSVSVYLKVHIQCQCQSKFFSVVLK